MTGGYAPENGQGYDPGEMMNHDGVAWVLQHDDCGYSPASMTQGYSYNGEVNVDAKLPVSTEEAATYAQGYLDRYLTGVTFNVVSCLEFLSLQSWKHPIDFDFFHDLIPWSM